MPGERGLDVSYKTVRRWFPKFGSTIAANLRVHGEFQFTAQA